jgi:IPT/TIG domain
MYIFQFKTDRVACPRRDVNCSPQYGPLAGGTRLTIYGNQFVYSSNATHVPATRRRRKRQQVVWEPQVATISEVLFGDVPATVDSYRR